MTVDSKEQNDSQQENKYFSVSFHPMVIVKKCLHINNYTDEEFANVWYSHDELHRINQELFETVELMEGGFLKLDNELVCKRGLESRTNDGNRRKFQTRYDSRMAVLQVQKLYNEGKCHESMISVVYSQQTQKCAKDAYKTGLKDHQAITVPSTTISVHRLKSEDTKPAMRSFRKKSGKTGLRQLSSRAA